MEGVVQRGTGDAVKAVGRPIAGKTGTTNDYRDAWFEGFTPDLAAGVYVGYDDPRSLGKDETGGHVAAPIFRDFMIAALKNAPVVDFRIPPGLELYRVSAATGLPVSGDGPAIYEAYKPGTAPGQGRVVAHPSAPDENGAPAVSTSQADGSQNVGNQAGQPGRAARPGATRPGAARLGAAMTVPATPRAATREAAIPPPATPGLVRPGVVRPGLARPQAIRCCRRMALPPAAPAGYISGTPALAHRERRTEQSMRAEIEAAAGDIRRSLALLRRHL